MEITDLLTYRSDLMEQAKDEFGFVQQHGILSEVLPFMLDAKLVDSEEANESYLKRDSDDIKLNAYAVSETGERLQLFMVDETTIQESADEGALLVSERIHYETQFKRGIRLIKSAISGVLSAELQESDPGAVLVNKLASSAGLEQFDVIELFLISLTATVSFKGVEPQPKDIFFKEQALKAKFSLEGEVQTKEILLKRRVVDLNFLANAMISRGRRETLIIDFKDKFASNVEIIKAADQANFESYLCVLEANILYELYRSHGARLLEKNVRSFLNFQTVNKGIKATIRSEPEKFIAYNNGVTITASKAKLFHYKKKTYLESLADLQIVNGGQTTATIYFSKKEGLDISDVKVMAKINVAKGESDDDLDDLVSKISKFSNTQSRVSDVDLRARSPELISLKQLSESVLTPEGGKWFFERARGEFNTLVRRSGSRGASIKKQFPPGRRFSKEQLAKYYSAWGEQPYLVKKGGEKVFRHFIEAISKDGDSEAESIDRDFYEALVAKIILFRRLEKIYGSGPNSIGQLRAAVIPYSMAVVYVNTDGLVGAPAFNMELIWKQQDLSDDLAQFFEVLMRLINQLIKKYSASDDFGEYSKRPELWESIKKSPEIREFMRDPSNKRALKQYRRKGKA